MRTMISVTTITVTTAINLMYVIVMIIVIVIQVVWCATWLLYWCSHLFNSCYGDQRSTPKTLHHQQWRQFWLPSLQHYNDVIMSMIASQTTSLTFVYSTVYSGADQRKHQSSASLAFVWGIHRGPVNSPHKWPVTRKMFPFNDVIMRFGW